MRAGDLEVRQTVSAGGASSSVGHDDLTRGEIFGDAALKVRLRDSVAGLHVGGSTGPDGSRSWTGGVSFDYQGLRPSSEGVGRRGSAYPTDDPLKWKMQACALREVRGTSACMTVEALRC